MSIAMLVNANDLDSLPVGSVILDSGRNIDQHCWEKTDDTELRDEDGKREFTAWGSIAWKHDRTSHALEAEGFLPARLLYEAKS